MTSPMPIRLPQPTRCPHCNHMPLAAEAVCRWCKRARWEKPEAVPGRDEHQLAHPGDRLVGLAAGVVFCAYAFLTLGGFA